MIAILTCFVCVSMKISAQVSNLKNFRSLIAFFLLWTQVEGVYISISLATTPSYPDRVGLTTYPLMISNPVPMFGNQYIFKMFARWGTWNICLSTSSGFAIMYHTQPHIHEEFWKSPRIQIRVECSMLVSFQNLIIVGNHWTPWAGHRAYIFQKTFGCLTQPPARKAIAGMSPWMRRRFVVVFCQSTSWIYCMHCFWK